MARYNETDYMYGSARVRALESGIVGADRLNRLIEADSSAQIMAMLSELGFDAEAQDSREDVLLAALSKAYAEVDSMSDGRKLSDFLRYLYDCNNIKSIIKCHRRGVEPDGLLFYDLGTLDADAARAAFSDKDYSAYPKNMARAIPVAEQTLAATGKPQSVDLILDRACYADMLEAAERTGVEYAVRLVKAKIDLTNVIICLRVLRMKLSEAALPTLYEAMLSGGTLTEDIFVRTLSEGEGYLSERLSYTDYARIALMLEGGSFAELEKACDDVWMELARSAKYVPFGAEVLIGYLIAVEYSVKNIRIILASKDASLSAESIRERLRYSYV